MVYCGPKTQPTQMQIFDCEAGVVTVIPVLFRGPFLPDLCQYTHPKGLEGSLPALVVVSSFQKQPCWVIPV